MNLPNPASPDRRAIIKNLAAWLYESFPVFQEWFPIPALFLLALYTLAALIGLVIAAWLFWKWFNSGLDGISAPGTPGHSVVVVHELRALILLRRHSGRC